MDNYPPANKHVRASLQAAQQWHMPRVSWGEVVQVRDLPELFNLEPQGFELIGKFPPPLDGISMTFEGRYYGRWQGSVVVFKRREQDAIHTTNN